MLESIGISNYRGRRTERDDTKMYHRDIHNFRFCLSSIESGRRCTVALNLCYGFSKIPASTSMGKSSGVPRIDFLFWFKIATTTL
jgi:hypothetical protein